MATDPAPDSPAIHRYSTHGIPCASRGTGPPALIFSHGFEAGMDDGMTRDVAEGFAPYAAIVCWDGTSNLTERIAGFHAVIAAHEPPHGGPGAAIGGRSMGARAAVTAALARKGADAALVLVSWPLFAGKSGERREPARREQILLDLPATTDVLFAIGTADLQCPVGVFAEFRTRMAARCWVVEVEGANHRMEVDGAAAADRPMRMMTGRLAAEWLRSRDETNRLGRIEWDSKEERVVWSGWKEAL